MCITHFSIAHAIPWQVKIQQHSQCTCTLPWGSRFVDVIILPIALCFRFFFVLLGGHKIFNESRL